MVPIKLPREQKLQLVSNLQQYAYDELSVDMGQLAGENMLDFMMKELAPYIYNQAMADARRVIEQRMASIEEELYALERPVPPVK
ncbi:DUF2164 domain-containing protein [Paenibacillus pinisoli]|uniref:DUF2164 domain-containing protein n=1 Tax=Paenibacillus pinisoli TaxID=1276110 RepID=A0A3A6PE54_9BACL|nr:DUF2164 domain-containing protein [Paenibacillus pinisoli]RJX38925.1 DUF2164 domain-containing protein [Paenibacillus pinisoli]